MKVDHNCLATGGHLQDPSLPFIAETNCRGREPLRRFSSNTIERAAAHRGSRPFCFLFVTEI